MFTTNNHIFLYMAGGIFALSSLLYLFKQKTISFIVPLAGLMRRFFHRDFLKGNFENWETPVHRTVGLLKLVMNNWKSIAIKVEYRG